ncbi:MAG: flagellar filament capping protein FliD [Succinivibrio sp.]
MTTITNAGVGSGNDFESIIEALVSSKKSSLTNRTTKAIAKLEIEQDGVKALKTALSSFQTACEELCSNNAFNTRKVTTGQKDDYTAFTIQTESDCTNTNFDVTVTQLAQSEKASKKFASDSFSNSFAAGKITVDLGPETYTDEDGNEQTRDRTFTVDVAEGDSLELIRKRLNNNDYGVSVNLIKTESGYTMSVDSGVTGLDSSNLKITAENSDPSSDKDSLSLFNFGGGADDNGWSYTEGKNAEILIDGEKLVSKTNTFENQISSITLTVSQLSEKETITAADGTTSTGFKSYNVNITTDLDAATSKMQNFVDQYNTLMSKMSELYAHNSYEDGVNQYDGGDLAGDTQLKSIQNAIQSMVSRFSNSDGGLTVFDCGLEVNKDGTLSLNTTDFKNAVNKNFNSVINLFTDKDEGLCRKLSDYVEDYTKTGGQLTDRLDEISENMDYWKQKESDNEEKLEKYESMLRTKYGNLDSLMASYNTSSTYISQILSSSSSK